MTTATPSPLKRPTDGRDPAATRAALLEAGGEIFARDGYGGARVGAIAERAGVNKAMISYHFGGKRGLYAAVLGAALSALGEAFEPVRGRALPADRRLRLFIEGFAATVEQLPAFPSIMLREMLSGGRHLDDETLSKVLEIFALVGEVLEHGAEEGRFRPVDPLLTHVTLMGSLVFFFATRSARESLLSRGGLDRLSASDRPALYVQHLEELFLGGLVSPSSGRVPPSS